MRQINLYKHNNSVGPVDISGGGVVHGYRLVADGGMIITDETIYTYVIDVLAGEECRWSEVLDFQTGGDD